MLNKGMSSAYYLFSLSNLLAAFGGGLILGKAVNIIDLPWLHGGSILAFFTGTLLGLSFLQIIPEKLSQQMGRFFSLSCAMTSLMLFYIYHHYSSHYKLNGSVAILFFTLLSIRFGLWFYSRVMRASQAAGQQQSIAWVEMGYYSGMVLGLIMWELVGFDIDLGTALIIDACFQFMAGILDYKGNALQKTRTPLRKQASTIHAEMQSTQYTVQWRWKLASTVVAITVGIQIVIFNSAHYAPHISSGHIMGVFYLGVAISAFLCNQYTVYITWNSHSHRAFIQAKNRKLNLSLFWLFIIAIMAVMATVYCVHIKSEFLLIGFFVFIAALIYETISLALLDRLGYEEKMAGCSGIIIKTYGLMGLFAAITLWILSLIQNFLTSSLITVALCLAIALLLILKGQVSVGRDPSFYSG